MPAVEIRSKAVLGTHEIVGVAGCSGIADFCHFLHALHTAWNNMRGDLDVEDKVAVLKFDMPDRPAFHEFFPSHGISSRHGRGARRGPETWGWGIIWLVRKWRGCLILVVRVEVSLRVIGMKGLGLPLVVVMMGMVGGRRGRVIWNNITGWGLVIERIVLPVVSHGFKGGD